jgi:cell wall-associated NlpC family hydrolase
MAEYIINANLDLYDSPKCLRLATQAAKGRHLQVLQVPDASAPDRAIAIRLCEDDYPAWITASDLTALATASTQYQPPVVSATDIQARLTAVIAFAHQAMRHPNVYLWGGTIGPDYDCSGLMQAAFAAVGVWLPRDAYQQEAFTQAVAQHDLQRGDLVFFGTPEKATHVGLYLGEDQYIHSSGQQGRNGIGIDSLVELSDPISQSYRQQLRGYGRVTASYQSTGKPYSS